ncbi:DUF3906 family protein [Paenibacillus lutrae]|uniref:DUF3906 family protein n=1 Tax=Paenibacillus lutrae TaxID=2078573 RepID=A0A7X3FF30_9BACL|nr:DUF3906 family protein [Paenibacillus lutrae]MVO98511.1 DUF3906 family protein [Paenibacillus lutrae]
MFLYKIEMELQEGLSYLIVAADSDEKAFEAVEGHLIRHFTVAPEVKEAAIVEKKRLNSGAGYVIETSVSG